MLQNGSDAELVCLAIANDITRLEVFYNRAGFQDLDDNMRGPMSTINTNIDRRYTLFIDRVREDNAGDYICLVGDFITGSVTVLNVVPFTISVFGEYIKYSLVFKIIHNAALSIYTTALTIICLQNT